MKEAVDFQISDWLRGEEGGRLVQKRVASASLAFSAEGLRENLSGELSALLAPGSRDFRFATSLWRLSGELAVLCLAGKLGIEVSARTWERVTRDFIPLILAIDEVNFQGRTNHPKWNSDLSTAEIGVNLALALHLDVSGRLDHPQMEAFLRRKCLEPILADWIDHDTRLHSLNTMGHNWWAVIVGGAGIMALTLGENALADRIAGLLYEWFHFEGRDLSRKRPNFGPEGDFVECFHYADYGLVHPVVFSLMYPSFNLVPRALDERQIRGFAAWLRQSIFPAPGDYPQQRFGDIQLFDGFTATVWQTVAKLADDGEMMALAHQLRPEPRHIHEMLFWEPSPSGLPPSPSGSSLQVFPNSGIAFFRHDDLRLTVRAGEFWGHNHLDAGSYIFHQSGITWIDDSGVCEYGRSEYPEYYVSARAHNVAFAPELSPPSRRTHYEGLPSTARYLAQAHEGPLKLLCADTNILSGGALARSYRWFLELGGEAVLIWDDLAAYEDRSFSYFLHSTCAEEKDGQGNLALERDGKRCPLAFFSSVKNHGSVGDAPMGQQSGRGEKPVRDLTGRVLSWETSPAKRVKFGLVLGTRFRSAEWHAPADGGGIACTVAAESAVWRVWFNPRADGQVMHENCTAQWGEFTTDAYALILREQGGRWSLNALEASFVRRGETLLQGDLKRRPMMTLELESPVEDGV